MPLITWSDSLSVGVRIIDEQHKVLVDTLNELHAAMMKGKAKEVTGPILGSLIAYTRDHFLHEEGMLAKAGYAGLEAHKAQHRELTRKVESYLQRFERGDITLNLHLMHFLRDWLTIHIQRADRAYVPTLLAQEAVHPENTLVGV